MMGMMMGCNNDVPVIEVPQAKSSSEPDLIKTNRMIAQRENSEIENFAARRNWKMTDIGSGIKVMKTCSAIRCATSRTR